MSLTEYRIGDKAIWNQGRIYEQERIIKLLETDLLRFMYWDDDSSYAKGINLTGFIALIKGENK